MNTMDCQDIKALLSAIIDDELDAARRHATERHLADCAVCRAMVDEAEGLNDLIALDAQSRSGGASLPEAFERRVLQQTVYADGLSLRRLRWRAWSGWFAAAASLTLAAVVWMDNQHQPGTAGDPVAMSMPETMTDALQPASPHHSQTVVRPATYTTGVNLRSQTFDGGLPADAFRARNTALIDVTVPYDPVFERSGDAPIAAERTQRKTPLDRDDAAALYSASLLIDMFATSDLPMERDLGQFREVIDADELLPRLAAARTRVPDADRPLVFAAEAVLMRLAHGPLSDDDAESLQEAVDRMDLVAMIEAMSER